MSEFEALAVELIGKVETDHNGMYSMHTEALFNISVDVLFDGGIKENQWKEEIIRRFYQKYPYLEHTKINN